MAVRGDPGAAAGGVAQADTLLLTGESPALVRVIALRRRHVGRREKGPPQLGDEQEMQQVAQGKRAPFIADRDIEGERMRVLVSRGPNGWRSSSRAR